MAYKTQTSQNLSKNEQHYINMLFDLQVDTKSLTKAFNKNTNRDNYAEYNMAEDRITFFGEEFTDCNMTEEASVLQFASFIHETTHAYQYQNGNINYAPHIDNDGYVYALHESSVFVDFGIEQQASIMEDYAAAFLHPYEIVENHSKSNANWNTELVKKVVEDKFPNAAELRKPLDEMDRDFGIRQRTRYEFKPQ